MDSPVDPDGSRARARESSDMAAGGAESQQSSADTNQRQRRFNANVRDSYEIMNNQSDSQRRDSRTATADGETAYPFEYLCPPDSDLITLQLSNNDMLKVVMLPPGARADEALYSAIWAPSKNQEPVEITITHHMYQEMDSKRPQLEVCKFQTRADTVKLKTMPGGLGSDWIEESLNYLGPQGSDWWSSKEGTLEGHQLQWITLCGKSNGFPATRIRCFDVTDEYRDVCTVTHKDWRSQRIEIPVHLIGDQRGLDEMVMVAFAALQQRLGWPDFVDALPKNAKLEEGTEELHSKLQSQMALAPEIAVKDAELEEEEEVEIEADEEGVEEEDDQPQGEVDEAFDKALGAMDSVGFAGGSLQGK
jgi:hypothetical protein